MRNGEPDRLTTCRARCKFRCDENHAFPDCTSPRAVVPRRVGVVAAVGAPRRASLCSGCTVTLIIGIRCTDGIVMAADGAATLGSSGNVTAQQCTLKKLSVFRDQLIVGVAGHIGLGQQVRAALEESFAGDGFPGRAEIAMRTMRDRMWRVVQPELEAAAFRNRTTGDGTAGAAAEVCTLAALVLDGRPHLVQFNEQCSPELASESLPWVAIGSGGPTADPFVGFIRRVVWTSPEPSIELGIFSAVWALRHAELTGANGIAGPFQVCVLESARDGWMAHELSRDDLVAHEEAIGAAEQNLREWRGGFTSRPGSKTPPPPPA